MKLFRKVRNDPILWIKNSFPIFKWLPKYRISDVPYDFMSGLMVGLTMIPITLALAEMCLLRPEHGLYSSFLGQFIYLFLGTSKDAVITPSAISSMLLTQFNERNSLHTLGDNTYASILALSNGITLAAMGAFKLSFIVNLFSMPVVSGFTSAAAFATSTNQLKSLLGIRNGPSTGPGMFFKLIKNIYDRRHEIKELDFCFGLSALAFLLVIECSYSLALRRLKNGNQPRGKFLLEMLRLTVATRNVIVFIPATGLAYYLYLQNSKEEMKTKLTVVGYIKPGLPTPSMPNFQVINVTMVDVFDNATNTTKLVENRQTLQNTEDVLATLSVAFITMPLLVVMEMFAILKALGHKNGYRIDSTQELVALGLANFAQSFISALPVTTAAGSCVLNDQLGVRSLLSTIVRMTIVLLTLTFMTDIFFYVPKAVLSAILIASSRHLFDYKAAVRIWREYKPDFFLFAITFMLCLFVDLAYGMLIAIFLNILVYLHSVVQMRLSVSTNSHGDGSVTIVQMSHGMKYPSVDKFIDKMAHMFATSKSLHFVLDCRFITGFDFTGLQSWRVLLRMAFHHNKHVIFTHLTETARNQLESIGLENFRHTQDVETAILAFATTTTATTTGHCGQGSCQVSHSMQKPFSVVSSRKNSEKQSRSSVSSITNTGAYVVPEAGLIGKDLSDQQLVRVMERTGPNFYGDIPITVGSVEDEYQGVWDEDIDSDDQISFSDPFQLSNSNSNLHFDIGSFHSVQMQSPVGNYPGGCEK